MHWRSLLLIPALCLVSACGDRQLTPADLAGTYGLRSI
jgi:hypothetical protein